MGRKHVGVNGTFSAITTSPKLWSFRHKRYLSAEEPFNSIQSKPGVGCVGLDIEVTMAFDGRELKLTLVVM